MEIRKLTVGQSVNAGKLKPFTFFEWKGKIYIKLCNRNKNIVDIWDMEENKPDWLMPNTEVRTASALEVKIQEPHFGRRTTYDKLEPGTFFYQAGVNMVKMWQAGSENRNIHRKQRNAYCTDHGFFIHVDEDSEVIELESECTVIHAAQ